MKKINYGDLKKITREWRYQGKPGARPIASALPGMRLRLVRDVVAELKNRKQQRLNKKIETVRVKMRVKNPGVLVVIDGAKIPYEQGHEGIVYRDRGSLSVNHQRAKSKFVNSSDTLKLLDHLKKNGRLPLIIGTDNGSPFCNDLVGFFLKINKVLHLKSLPRVPQHNGSAENAVGEYKRQVRDGASSEQTCLTLNDRRKRQTLNWQTPKEFEEKNFKPILKKEREEFYNAANYAIKMAMLGTKTAYEKRKAEREAIFQTLESFKLITRTRGHQLA